MPRYKLIIEYDGSNFVGWQWQSNGPSVQQALEDAIKLFNGLAVRVHGAGRTDAGVHALGQTCHIDLLDKTTPETLRDAINAHLRPKSICVLSAELVDPKFDARYSAKKRVYYYRIINRRSPLTLDKKRAWKVSRILDDKAMQLAANRLVGKHDFSSFRASSCQANSPIRTLEKLDITRISDEIHILAISESFLHHQVRAIVGSLVMVGEGRWTESYFSDLLKAQDRTRAGPNAPPWGLYLKTVIY